MVPELAPTETPGTRHFMKAPFRPEVAAKIKAVNAAREPAAADESGTLKTLQCQPPRFAGFSGGFVEDIEFLFSPGRVTVLNESGLMRRIFTGAERPDEAEDTNNGVSTGHWEGNTLVVETRSMNPDARFGPNWPGVPKIGRNVRVQERISLRNANTLEIAVRMEAPDLFTSPFSTTFVYFRDPGHQFHEHTDCVDADRSIDPKSGGQRFDLTPPSGYRRRRRTDPIVAFRREVALRSAARSPVKAQGSKRIMRSGKGWAVCGTFALWVLGAVGEAGAQSSGWGPGRGPPRGRSLRERTQSRSVDA